MTYFSSLTESRSPLEVAWGAVDDGLDTYTNSSTRTAVETIVWNPAHTLLYPIQSTLLSNLYKKSETHATSTA